MEAQLHPRHVDHGPFDLFLVSIRFNLLPMKRDKKIRLKKDLLRMVMKFQMLKDGHFFFPSWGMIDAEVFTLDRKYIMKKQHEIDIIQGEWLVSSNKMDLSQAEAAKEERDAAIKHASENIG